MTEQHLRNIIGFLEVPRKSLQVPITCPLGKSESFFYCVI